MSNKCNYNRDLNTVEAITCGATMLTELTEMACCIAELCSQNQLANIVIDRSELDTSLNHTR